MSPDDVRGSRAWALVTGWAFVIGIVTLLPKSGPPHQGFSVCLVCGDLGGVDVFWNTLLFVPLGAALALTGLRTRWALLAVCLATLTIELLQLGVIAGRDPSLSDLLTNTLGGSIGFGVTRHARRWIFPGRLAARVLASIAMVGALAVLALTVSLLRPSLFPGDYHAQWAPRQPQFAPFGGRILDFRIQGTSVPIGVVPDRQVYQRALLEGRSNVQADVVTGVPTPRLSAIGRAANFRAEAFLLGQTGRDLNVRFRLRAVTAGLRAPIVALPDAFSVVDERATIEGWMHNNRIHARVSDGRGVRVVSVALSPALGWSLILPFTAALAPGYLAISALWLACLAIPAGYWAGWLTPSRSLIDASSIRALTLIGVPLLAGLALSARFAQLPAPSPIEFTGLAGGTMAGWLVARLVAHRYGKRGGQ